MGLCWGDHPSPPPLAVDTCSIGIDLRPMPVESRRRSDAVPGFRLPLRVGSHCSPGYLWDAAWIKRRVVQPARGSPPVSPCPFWTKPITHVGLSHMTTIQTCVRVPAPTQLCSTGCAGGFSVTAFRSRFTVLRISRDRGDRASPLHLGERNYPSTEPKLSKTLRSRPLIPGHEAISRERIAALPCTRLSRVPTTKYLSKSNLVF
jgi:hypothetical protein